MSVVLDPKGSAVPPAPPQPVPVENGEVPVHDNALIGILDRALQNQITTTQDGFNRLESVGRDSQRDMRVIAFLLLFGLLASTGVNVYGKYAGAQVGMETPQTTVVTANTELPTAAP